MLPMKIAQIRNSAREIMNNLLLDDGDVITDILLSHIFGVERSELFLILDNEAPKGADIIMNEYISKLATGVPVQYILGECFFYGLGIEVGPGCFIPRSDTEVLAHAAIGVINSLSKDGKTVSFADICAGSGCISAAVAANCKRAEGVALELSRKAIVYTEKNLEKYENVTVRRFDALDEDDYISLSEIKTFDVLISNPPYIPTDDIELLSTQVHYEPETALDGGEDGLRFYRAILRYAPIIMKKEHTILFEVGIDQADTVRKMMDQSGYTTAVLKDLGGIDRVVLGSNMQL